MLPMTPIKCNYCKFAINHNLIPLHCVLNSMQVASFPPELQKLDSLSRQFVQRAKSYQTIIWLGTYTGRVPAYNSLKACNEVMFFLPLPLNRTLQTMDKVEQGKMPDYPEPYIIVNSKPVANKTAWHSLVNVDAIKKGIVKLQEINWLHKEVKKKSVDCSQGSHRSHEKYHFQYAKENQKE